MWSSTDEIDDELAAAPQWRVPVLTVLVGALWWLALDRGLALNYRIAGMLALCVAADAVRTLSRSSLGLAGVVLAVLGGAALTIAIADIGGGPIRDLETRVAVDLLRASGVDVKVPAKRLPGEVLVGPTPIGYAARITPSTAAAVPLAGLTALALFVPRSHWRRHLAAYFTAAAIVLLVNQACIVTTLLAGAWWGTSVMVVYHDLGGTALSILSTTFALLAFYRIALRRPISTGEEAACTTTPERSPAPPAAPQASSR